MQKKSSHGVPFRHQLKVEKTSAAPKDSHPGTSVTNSRSPRRKGMLTCSASRKTWGCPPYFLAKPPTLLDKHRSTEGCLLGEWTRFVLLLSGNLGAFEYWAPTKTPFAALPEGGRGKEKKLRNGWKEGIQYSSFFLGQSPPHWIFQFACNSK